MPAADQVDARRGGVPPLARRYATTAAQPAAHPAAHRASKPADPHPVELAGLLHELTALLLDASDPAEALLRMADLTRRAVPDAACCVAGLVGDGTPLVRAVSGEAHAALDEAQYALGQGPALDATRTRTLVTSADLAVDSRWPELTLRADEPVGVAAVPLDVRRHSVGALTVYLDRPGPVAPGALITAMALAGQAEVVLGEVLQRDTRERLTTDQIKALRAEAAVDHAVGVIIAQRGCDPTEAYAVLHETAERLDVPASVVAKRLIETAMRRGER